MDIRLLTIPGCPHGASAWKLFASALEQEGLDSALLTVTDITTQSEAAAASFHGSPSFVMDGIDLFPSSAAPAVSCRVYRGRDGLSGQPDLESLRTAIRDRGRFGRRGT